MERRVLHCGFGLLLAALAGCTGSDVLTLSSPEGRFSFRCEVVQSNERFMSTLSKDPASAPGSVVLAGEAEGLILSGDGKELAVALRLGALQYEITILDADTLRVKRRWPLAAPKSNVVFMSAVDRLIRSTLKDFCFTEDGDLIGAAFATWTPLGIGNRGSAWVESGACWYDASTGEIVRALVLDAGAKGASGLGGSPLNTESIDYNDRRAFPTIREVATWLRVDHGPKGRVVVLSMDVLERSSQRFHGYHGGHISIRWEKSGAVNRGKITNGYKVLYDPCFDPGRTRLACWDWTDNTCAAANVIVWDLTDGSLVSVTPVNAEIEGMTYDPVAASFRADVAGGPPVYAAN